MNYIKIFNALLNTMHFNAVITINHFLHCINIHLSGLANIIIHIFKLTHISLSSFCGTLVNSAKPAQTLQNTASYQVLCCLQSEVSFKF